MCGIIHKKLTTCQSNGRELAFLALDQERGTLARVGYLVNQPRTYGITARINF